MVFQVPSLYEYGKAVKYAQERRNQVMFGENTTYSRVRTLFRVNLADSNGAWEVKPAGKLRNVS